MVADAGVMAAALVGAVIEVLRGDGGPVVSSFVAVVCEQMEGDSCLLLSGV